MGCVGRGVVGYVGAGVEGGKVTAGGWARGGRVDIS